MMFLRRKKVSKVIPLPPPPVVFQSEEEEKVNTMLVELRGKQNELSELMHEENLFLCSTTVEEDPKRTEHYLLVKKIRARMNDSQRVLNGKLDLIVAAEVGAARKDLFAESESLMTDALQSIAADKEATLRRMGRFVEPVTVVAEPEPEPVPEPEVPLVEEVKPPPPPPPPAPTRLEVLVGMKKRLEETCEAVRKGVDPEELRREEEKLQRLKRMRRQRVHEHVSLESQRVRRELAEQQKMRLALYDAVC
jgi:hypothetical protein